VVEQLGVVDCMQYGLFNLERQGYEKQREPQAGTYELAASLVVAHEQSRCLMRRAHTRCLRD